MIYEAIQKQKGGKHGSHKKILFTKHPFQSFNQSHFRDGTERRGNMKDYTEIEIKINLLLNKKQIEEITGYWKAAEEMGFKGTLNEFCKFVISCDCSTHLMENARYIIEHNSRIRNSRQQ